MKFFGNLFKRNKVKPVVFIDGDQSIPAILKAYDRYANKSADTYFIRLTNGRQEPKALRNRKFNKIWLDGYTTGKEVVDKFIGCYIQKVIAEGTKDITVISGDYDFIDIFKMAVELNPEAAEYSFKLIIPSACRGKLKDLPAKVANIDIVKTKG